MARIDTRNGDRRKRAGRVREPGEPKVRRDDLGQRPDLADRKRMLSLFKSPASRDILEISLAGALFLALAGVVTIPLYRNLAGSLLERGDSLQIIWLLVWNSRNLFADPLTLFNAPIMHPVPLSMTYIEHMRGLLVIFTPAYRLTDNPILAFNLSLILGYALTGLGSFIFLRAMLPRGVAAWSGALVAGMIFAFNPWRLVQFTHLEQVSGIWVGISLFFLYRYLEQKRWPYLIGLAGFSALQTLVSYYYVIVCGVLLLGVILFASRTKRTNSQAVWIAIATLGLFLLVVHLPLALVYIKNHAAAVIQPSEQHFFSLQSPQDLLGSYPSEWIRSLIFGRDAIEMPNMERMADAGLASYLLAIVASILAFRGTSDYRQAMLACLLAIGVSLLLSLGPYIYFGDTQITAPFGFMRAIPGVGSLRAPARLWQIGLFGISVMGGLASYAILNKLNYKIIIPIIIACCILVFANTRVKPDEIASAVVAPNVCRWIDESLPRDAILLHIPWTPEYALDHGVFVWPEAEKMFCAIYHQRRTVNGSLAYMPQDQIERQKCIAHFPGTEAIACIRKIGVTHLLIDRKGIAPSLSRRMETPAKMAKLGFREIYRDNHLIVYERQNNR